jgi:2-(3-amino-3-carboxypropyl)histidine synthase
MPEDIDTSPALNAALKQLPSNYNFEVKKTVWKIRVAEARRVALQFPEGLLMFSCIIADIISQFTGAECIIMGDVTYGACCVDDLGAAALDCDFMVHYGHSCLVPIDQTASTVKMLYVFVDIAFDTSHLVACIRANFAPALRLTLLGTIQFAPALHAVKAALEAEYPSLSVPQAKPLSPGEVLGCTSPKLPEGSCDAFVFVADGRFHLESMMIHNPTLPAYRYDPYGKVMTREHYETAEMHGQRQEAIARAAAPGTHRYGLVLGTLGRQGNPVILERLERRLVAAGKRYFVLLLSELSPAKLARFDAAVDAWIQIACPRLSIDWGAAFSKPLLTPYEAEVALGITAWREVYPMDYYARGSGSWTNYHNPDRPEGGARGGAAGSSSAAAVAARRRARAAAAAAAPDAGVAVIAPPVAAAPVDATVSAAAAAAVVVERAQR